MTDETDHESGPEETLGRHGRIAPEGGGARHGRRAAAEPTDAAPPADEPIADESTADGSTGAESVAEVTVAAPPADEPIGEAAEQAAKRDAVRMRAGELLAGQKRRERRRRWFIWVAMVVVMVVAAASVSFALLTSPRKSNSAPASASGNGIPVSIAEVLAAKPSAAPSARPSPSASAPQSGGSPTASALPIRLFVNYATPSSAAFERANANQIASWVASGAATLEVFPLVVSAGADDPTQYSLRSANAAACVAEIAPDRFYDFSSRLMLAAPQKGQAMPSDQRLLQLAADSGVGHASAMKSCVGVQRFERWLGDASAAALTGPLPSADIQAIDPDETPAVIVGGKHYPWSDPSDSSALALFFATAAGDEFNQESTATPTPSSIPSASPTP